MLVQRTEDAGASVQYRSDRISSVNGRYFFTTREGTLEGPFFTRDDAQREIAFYIARFQQAANLLENCRLY
ncbi:DUF6316 family protein [Pseudomonas sp. LRF_L74]|uniref:DUF6316 family protein n=1 Tax=Pseudomonas sp. LRF_L74 TaxID=3369422 RepID=UPI003F60BA88